MLVVIIDVYLAMDMADYMDVNPFGAAIFILTLNHADVIVDQSDVVTQNGWFLYTLCAAISGEISILIQTGAESWGRFPVPRICCWESTGSFKNIILRHLKQKEDDKILI